MANPQEVLRTILHQAVLFSVGSLSAERVVAVYQGCGVLHGLDAPTLWVSGEISTTLLQSLLEEKEPMVMIDAAQDSRTRDQTSAILSALRSVLYVPLRDFGGRVVGMLYADHRNRAGVFDTNLLNVAKQYVDDVLSPQLLGACRQVEGVDLDWDGLTGTNWL